MFKTELEVILWRFWDFIIKSIWVAVPKKLRDFLWKLISSRSQIRAHIEDILSTSSGVIIQVGSNDGVTNDPLYDSILRYKRESYLVEPVDYLAEKLRSLHKLNPYVKVCQFAIHPTLGALNFFVSRETQILRWEIYGSRGSIK
jgi:hypothetical protein